MQTFTGKDPAAASPAQLDYVFASKPLVSAIVGCHVVNDETSSCLSDHCPVVLELRDMKA